MNSILVQLSIWCGLTVLGYFIGLFLKNYVLAKFAKVADHTSIIVDDAIIHGLRRIAIYVLTLSGFWAGYIYTTIYADYRPNIKQGVVVAFILLITWCIIIIVNQIVHWQMGKMGRALPQSSILLNLINVALSIIGILFVLQSLGISILPALTALGVGGLAVALALQDTLSNLFAGIQLIASQKIKVGDYLQLSATEEGFLQDISWRNSTIKTPSNHVIIIPNNKIASSVVKNFDLPDVQNSVLVAVGVSYDSDLERVEAITIEVGREIQERVENAVRGHVPLIRYNEFADSSINFNVILRGEGFPAQFLMRHEFIKALHARYKAEGIEIPFPIRTLHMKNVPSVVSNPDGDKQSPA